MCFLLEPAYDINVYLYVPGSDWMIMKQNGPSRLLKEGPKRAKSKEGLEGKAWC